MLRIAMHFASGNSLISGLAMLVVAHILATRITPARRAPLMLARLLFCLGAAFVVLSTTPIPGWGWLLFAFSLVPLAAGLARPPRELTKSRNRFQLATAAFLIVAAAMLCVELGVPSGPIRDGTPPNHLVVIGDSLSAAETDPRLQSWPALLEGSGWSVDNRAQMGATAKSALRQVDSGTVADSIVLVMIGGNDILGSTSAPIFESSLEELVSHASTDATTVILFELPLPPLHFEWGRIIRRVADRHRCRLISRRVVAQVLGGDGNTVDGIHLSQAGHDAMARLVETNVLPASLKAPR